VTLGDHRLSAQTVPLLDQAETMGFFDEAARVFFSADCCGAVVPDVVAFADELPEAIFQRGFTYWNQTNHPWLRLVAPAKFAAEVVCLRQLAPRVLASTHGPVIRQHLDQVYAWLAALPEAAPAPPVPVFA
jgi:flavorubredoxin